MTRVCSFRFNAPRISTRLSQGRLKNGVVISKLSRFGLYNQIWQMRLFIKNNFALLLLALFCSLFIGAEFQKDIIIEASMDRVHPGRSRGMIRCYANAEVFKHPENAEFRLIVFNNLSNRSFELIDDHYELIKLKPKKKGRRKYLLFEASFDELFYKKRGESPYRWTWSSRSEAPLSPIADLNKEKVEKLQCSFSLKSGNTTYASNLITLEVVQ